MDKIIISNLPTSQVSNIVNLPNFAGLSIADPNFGKAGRIDLLLGGHGRDRGDTARQSQKVSRNQSDSLPDYLWLDHWWTLTLDPNNQPTQGVSTLHISQPDPGVDLNRFWELEELPKTSNLSPDEQLSVDHFQTSHRRSPDGRYVVLLPKKKPTPSPSILFVKILLQKLWQLKLGWEDSVPETILSDWQKWREDLHLLTKHPISRCYLHAGKSVQQLKLHGFSDASEAAYAAESYTRIQLCQLHW